MSVDVSDEREVRIDKIRQLREKGIDPYPAHVERTHHIQQTLDDFDKLEKAELNCKITSWAPVSVLYKSAMVPASLLTTRRGALGLAVPIPTLPVSFWT